MEVVYMAVDAISILWFAIIGGIAGGLASILIVGRGFGILGDILVGIVGAVVGGWLFGGAMTSVGMFFIAFLGAVILLAIVKMIRRFDTTEDMRRTRHRV
jgi:uncharacterized membrane protein YeaQ/YmgE (transglycosylase-associated protein family)